MKELEEKISKEGKVLPGSILKVGSFLNHQIDVEFLMSMGDEIARLFANDGVNKILTIESSGIAIAVAAAAKMKVPVVFAKKNKTSNISSDVYSVDVESYTHQTTYKVVVSREFLLSDDKILIVDDFLANGNALKGLNELAQSAGASVVGAAVAIEKVYQNGGNRLRKNGFRIEALAAIESMTDDEIVFAR